MTETWLFLGDSLTQGVGSKRISYASQLQSLLDDRSANTRVVNLAAEATTVKQDLHLLDEIQAVNPEYIFIMRGALEGIVRPQLQIDGDYPAWFPKSWRRYAGLDPRCYWSDTWWRRWKDQRIDWIKQHLRMHLLRTSPNAQLLDDAVFEASLVVLLSKLCELDAHLYLLGLPSVSETTFPGSSEAFLSRNQLIKQCAQDTGAIYLELDEGMYFDRHYYRDGFHPNQAGAELMAASLLRQLGFVT